MNIKILGTGCKKCLALENKVREMLQQNSISAEVEKVTDINEIMKYPVMMTPGLVIDEKVKSFGVIPKDDQLLNWLKGN
ncbi:MAG TPA: thioredoxin family protein [Ignavibacteriaceae bacterium]|nr:thioredoxin family protein [Ignavibacteriaceae bacterium]